MPSRARLAARAWTGRKATIRTPTSTVYERMRLRGFEAPIGSSSFGNGPDVAAGIERIAASLT